MQPPVVLRTCGILAFLVICWPTKAQTLMQAFEQAKNSDPIYLSAMANQSAAQAKSKQAVAAMLPQLTATLSSNSNFRTYTTRDSSIPPAQDQYNSNNRQINLTQPLWRHSNEIAFWQAEAVNLQTNHQLLAAEQEMAAKLISAWCDILQARDAVLFSSSQTLAAQEQLNVLKRGVVWGTQAEPALEDARTKYEQAQADQLTAETDLHSKIATLEQITGPLSAFTPPFVSMPFKSRLLTLFTAPLPHPENNQAMPPSTQSLEDWLKHAETNNPNILATQHALKAAHEEVQKQRAGHEPTVDIVSSYGFNNQNAGNFPGQNGYQIKQKSIGFQVNVPLFSGGGQNAKIDEALAMEEKARQDMEAARRTTRLSVQQAWWSWQAAHGHHRAALQALKSSTLALKTATTGKQTGLKIELDRLQAQQQRDSARRDLTKALYEMTTALFKLKAASGQLQHADIQQLDQMFSVNEPDANAWMLQE